MHPFDMNALHAALGDAKGFSISFFDTIPSTNAALRDAAKAGAPSGTVYIADTQSAGRGTRGRSFVSPAGTGLYLSLLVRTGDDRLRSLMTCAAAVALRSAIADVTGISVGIKWVNDLIRDGLKISGILCEAVAGTDAVVIGVGVNVFAPGCGFPDELRGIAGALLPAPEPGVRERIAARFLLRMRDLLETRFETVPGLYAVGCVSVNRDVLVHAADGPREAFAVGLDENCRLLVRYADGEEEYLSSGEISVRFLH